MLVDHSRVSESYLRLGQELEPIRDLHLGEELQMLLILDIDFLAFNVVPAIRAEVITMHVAEDMGLITASIYVELIEVPHETMIGPRLWCILGVKIDPLLLQSLELRQIVEVNAAFTSVASKEKDAIFEGETVGARTRSRLIIRHLRVEWANLLPIVRD